MKKIIFLCVLQILIGISASRGQTSVRLTLQDCYAKAVQNYPLVKRRDLIARTSAYNIDNIKKGYLPQLTINGQASYQSAVTEIPIKVPGATPLMISKDQYKIYGEINQVLYDGGVIDGQRELQKAGEAVNQRQLDAELYQVKSRINQLFFGVLLIDEQIKQSTLLIKDLQLGLNKVQASINNGVAFKSNADVIKAELLKNKQHIIELDASAKAYKDMLALFVGVPNGENIELIKPQEVKISQDINRPELKIYEQQDKSLDVQNKLLTAKALPKFSLFFQGGLGRPALNFLSNNFEAYYIGGLRLTWSPSVFYTLKKDKALIGINQQDVSAQRETFLFNTAMQVKQQDAEIEKYRQLLASDDEIIQLRDRVKTTALAQLENGVINGNDFLTEVNAEDEARQNKILHETQLLMSQYNLQTTTGNL
ncbi:MAG TPA: TolC family protein [Mucilaginibacter sp.]|nr:TolC family protein [Mucilaginibacter sp.]